MNKCPPAEACRDAFERMSKATLKMCLSTTGLGSRAANHHSHFQPRVYDNDTRFFTVGRDYQPQQDFSGGSQSPADPGTDSLRVPYPENSQDGCAPGGSMDGWSDSMQPNFHPTASSQQLQYQGSSNTLLQPREYYSNPSQPPPPLFTTAPFTTANVPDELHDFTSNDFDFLAMNEESMAIYQGNSGLHLGYDAEHDWSEGAQTELFGDFFFGGVGNAASAGQ